MNSALMRVGLVLLVAGLVVVLIGLLPPRAGGYFRWFGRLPGDIVIEREGLSVRIPITSSIVVSVALSLLFNVFRRLK